MQDQFDWYKVKPTEEDRERIEREVMTRSDDMIVMGLDSHAMYEREEIDGSVSERWSLSSRLVMKDGDDEPVAFVFTAKVPYAPMSVENAKERWTTILSTYLVSEWIPAYFQGDIINVEWPDDN